VVAAITDLVDQVDRYDIQGEQREWLDELASDGVTAT
jgi:hypothetical protein